MKSPLRPSGVGHGHFAKQETSCDVSSMPDAQGGPTLIIDRDVSTIVIETLAAVGVNMTIGRPVEPRAAIVATLKMLGVDRVAGQTLEQLGYSEPQAAAAIGTTRHALRAARENGQIKGRKIGRSYHYARDELLRFLGAEDSTKRNGKPWGGR